jgi:hypothetical protein
VNALVTSTLRFAVTFGQTNSWGVWLEAGTLIVKLGPLLVFSVERIYLVGD